MPYKRELSRLNHRRPSKNQTPPPNSDSIRDAHPWPCPEIYVKPRFEARVGATQQGDFILSPAMYTQAANSAKNVCYCNETWYTRKEASEMRLFSSRRACFSTAGSTVFFLSAAPFPTFVHLNLSLESLMQKIAFVLVKHALG